MDLHHISRRTLIDERDFKIDPRFGLKNLSIGYVDVVDVDILPALSVQNRDDIVDEKLRMTNSNIVELLFFLILPDPHKQSLMIQDGRLMMNDKQC